jgi:dTDP-4-amino-4,6-dideoxygalactose transaminase
MSKDSTASIVVPIPFSLAEIGEMELTALAQAGGSGRLAGDGAVSRECERILSESVGGRRVFLTPSCTAALELSAFLLEIGPGDEVILPSFTFSSTANAFALRGATPVFVDIRPDTLNLDEALVARAITKKTRAIVPVHYAGVTCEMDELVRIAAGHGLAVVEDAAQALFCAYRGKPSGGIGDIGCFSFHETKTFTSGEGGAIVLRSPELIARAEIVREKGTNRTAFFRNEVDKYTWVDFGSSVLPSELQAAVLLAQIKQRDRIVAARAAQFARYFEGLAELEKRGSLGLPVIPPHTTINYHLFYVIAKDAATRAALKAHLAARSISAVSHYEPLHSSPFARRKDWYAGPLPVTESVAGRLLRLPIYNGLTAADQDRVLAAIREFFAANGG